MRNIFPLVLHQIVKLCLFIQVLSCSFFGNTSMRHHLDIIVFHISVRNKCFTIRFIFRYKSTFICYRLRNLIHSSRIFERILWIHFCKTILLSLSTNDAQTIHQLIFWINDIKKCPAPWNFLSNQRRMQTFDLELCPIVTEIPLFQLVDDITMTKIGQAYKLLGFGYIHLVWDILMLARG